MFFTYSEYVETQNPEARLQKMEKLGEQTAALVAEIRILRDAVEILTRDNRDAAVDTILEYIKVGTAAVKAANALGYTKVAFCPVAMYASNEPEES